MTKCCLCGQEFEGFGNNPWPLNNDENARCCDKCNAEKVIPARIMQAYSKKEEVKEGEYSDIYGEKVDYTDMRKLITALREICDKAENDGFHKVLYKFKRAVNDLSNISMDLEEFYEDSSIKESEENLKEADIMDDSRVEDMCYAYSARTGQAYKVEGNEAVFPDGTVFKFALNADGNIKYYIIDKNGKSSSPALINDRGLIDKFTGIVEAEDKDDIYAIGFRVYITYEDEPGVYHSELYKEEYTEDIDRAYDIVAELRAQGLHASYEYIWNKEEDPNYDKDVDETNWAAEEEADAIDRLENRYGRVDEGHKPTINNHKELKEWDSSNILDAAFTAAEYYGEDPDWSSIISDIVDRIPKNKLKNIVKDNGFNSVDDFYNSLSDESYLEDPDSIISNLERYLTKKDIKEITDGFSVPEDEEYYEETDNINEAEDNSSDEYNKMKEIYMMDRVIRALNDESALYDYGWLYYVEDESTDRGFEYFYEENKSEGDWKNTYTTPFKHADGSEDEPAYEICKRLFKEILSEPDIAEAGILTRHWFDTHGGRSQWKTLSGATPEEVEFAKSINPNIKVID